MNTLGRKIFSLVVSLVLIIGGLSGQLVLRGTNSSIALVVVGFGLLIWNIYALATHKKEKQEEQEASNVVKKKSDELLSQILNDASPELLTTTRQIQVDLTPFQPGQYQFFLNGNSCGALSSDNKRIVIQTDRVKNVCCAVNQNDIKAYAFFTVTGDAAKGHGIVISAVNKAPVLVCTNKSGLTVIPTTN